MATATLVCTLMTKEKALRYEKIEELCRAAVEAGAIDECYLSLMRDAINSPAAEVPELEIIE